MKYIPFLFLLVSCSGVSNACPTVRPWTPIQQNQIAKALEKLPDDSPLNGVGVEWARLRAESKACLGAV